MSTTQKTLSKANGIHINTYMRNISLYIKKKKKLILIITYIKKIIKIHNKREN